MLMIGGLTYLYVIATNGRVPQDEIFCPKVGATSQTLVLVDTSDTIADTTRSEISQRLADVASAVPVGGRLTIRTLNAAGGAQIFDLCNPGDGSNLNEWTGSPLRAREKWQQGFAAPLADALKLAIGNNQADTSPIMAAIQRYAVDRLVAKAQLAIPTVLLVISDMMENTADFSMYKSGADFAAYLASPAATKYATNLRAADVEIWLIARLRAPAGANALKDFWERWVDRSSGSVAKILKLQGVSDG
jgi:hypothetical protein